MRSNQGDVSAKSPRRLGDVAATASCLYIPRFTTRSIIRFSDVRQSRTLTMDICNEAVMLLAQDPYLEDEQKEALALVLIVLAVNKAKARKGVRKARTVWVREWLLQRQHHGWYEKLMKHLEEGDVSSFKNFLSVDPEMFRKLVAHLNPGSRSKTLITGRPCPWFEGCYHSEVPCYRTLLQEPVQWFPCGSKHHCQYCPRGVPGHL